MSTRSSAFTLIELLVVIAIIGILSAVGTVAYNGYIGGTKKKAAENVLMQIGLAQTEYYSDTSTYYTTGSGTNCTPTSTTSTAIEGALLNGADLITDEIGFEMCIHEASPSNYKIVGKQTTSSCIIRVDGNQTSSRENC